MLRAARVGREAPVGGGDGRHLAGAPQREQAVEPLGAELAQRLPVLQLAAVVARDRARELHADRRGVDGAPGLRVEVEQHELVRAQRRVGLDAREPLVHALGVGVEARAQRGRQALELGAQLLERVVVAARDDVGLEPAVAEHLGDRALRAAAEQLELHEAVLRHRIADAAPQVAVVAGAHVGHAVGVARDRHARERLHGAGLIEARGLEGEGLEERDLVGELRVGPALGHEAGLPGRQHGLGLDDTGGRGDGNREQRRGGDDRNPPQHAREAIRRRARARSSAARGPPAGRPARGT